MSPKFANFELILIYFLLLIPWPNTQFMKYLCSKDNSRLVRKIVRSKWMPILDKYQVKLPLDCPLHPLRDIFAPRQDAKKRDRPTQWTCRLCGKSFYTEKFLDEHFERRHKTILNDVEDAICLDDFCDILRCDVFQSEEAESLKTHDQHVVTDIEVWGDSFGQNSALAKSNPAYLNLIPKRTSSTGGLQAAKSQNPRQFCQDHVASTKHKNTEEILERRENSAGSNKNDNRNINMDTISSATRISTPTNTKYNQNKANNAQTTTTSKSQIVEEDLKKDALNTTERENKTQNESNDNEQNGHNMPKMRANCKAEELSKLKTKCEYLIRSCIGGLLLSMNDQSFKEMEEEMNKAVCWYLSCDRYWEDGPLEPRAFPWVLILILVLVLSTGICFCYYIIWILFDSEETTINANHQIYGEHAIYQSHHAYPAPPGTHYYYQQAPIVDEQQQVVREVYHEPVPYEYRHSPHHYISSGGVATGNNTPTTAGVRYHNHTGTPLHQTNIGFQQDVLDRRDYVSRPLATTAVTSSGSRVGNLSGSVSNIGGASMERDINAIGVAAGGKHYNTLPRPLEAQHRHAGTSHQSLRGSSSSHEIIQNEIGHNEHYIYVTYPPDLKKRFFEKYE